MSLSVDVISVKNVVKKNIGMRNLQSRNGIGKLNKWKVVEKCAKRKNSEENLI